MLSVPIESNDGGGNRERRAVQTAFAIEPAPLAIAALQLAQRRPRAWWRSVLRPGLPISEIAKREIMGFAAHATSQMAVSEWDSRR
jgi:hypothetical protein